jgi:hypothetical protein
MEVEDSDKEDRSREVFGSQHKNKEGRNKNEREYIDKSS